ncbi:hypothetical protein PCANC_01180 [Puccinia coronata f. sp. avenae]|uniref:Hydrophobin n=1 Tax=Puccinia coronata f. sp. avenae TaxID=200324 RepID=A0A2N5W5Z0_9BASI|nr:hypothetical protein PCANC_01180 [Puccinia coronata f. sp. avenae]
MNFLQTILFLASATAFAQGAQKPVPPCTYSNLPIPWSIIQYNNEKGVAINYGLEQKDPSKTCKQQGLPSTICCTPNFKPDFST